MSARVDDTTEDFKSGETTPTTTIAVVSLLRQASELYRVYLTALGKRKKKEGEGGGGGGEGEDNNGRSWCDCSGRVLIRLVRALRSRLESSSTTSTREIVELCSRAILAAQHDFDKHCCYTDPTDRIAKTTALEELVRLAYELNDSIEPPERKVDFSFAANDTFIFKDCGNKISP